MKETAFIERSSSTFTVDAKRIAHVYTDSDSSGGELSDDSSHHAANLTSQLKSTSESPLTCLSQRSVPTSYINPSDHSERPSFDVLNNDLLIVILGFCDTASTRKMTLTNHRLRNLVVSQEADCIRREICHREWPWIDRTCRIVDDLQVPMHCFHETAATTEPNVLFLVSLAAEKMSCHIVLSTWRHRTRPSSNYALLQSLMLPDGRHAIQYQGPIGEGNRSIQADRPLPRPQRLTRQQIKRSMQLKNNRQHCWHSFLHRLFHRLPRHERPFWRPFVAPFMAEDGVHLTPRLISYYEVSVERPPEVSNEGLFRLNHHGPFRPRSEGDCMVVGLCTKKFHLTDRMAGWDNRSFGYHSDDGGVYHNQGQMIRKYGPTFGVGDTIGCGVDYQRRAIFYTLNGKFLGYAFEKVSMKILDQDLFPVVGVDTNFPVVCNFGCEQGFLFDLKSMVCNQSSIAFQSMLVDQSNES